MNDVIAASPPAWFRGLAGAGLAWNAIGVYFYLVTVGVVPGPAMEVAAAPAWVTGAYAISVFAGLLGSAGLFLGKRWSSWLLILSLIAIIAQDAWLFALGGGGTQTDFGMAAVVTMIGFVLVWMATYADRKGWLA